jgi:3,4-dihydroxy 2-butanone 4-phosphate synthase/GTP cyclohydrolase II
VSEFATAEAVEAAVEEVRSGKFVVVVDDEDRENEGDLIMAADAISAAAVAFMVRHTSGIICVPMEKERLDELHIGPMIASDTDSFRTAFTVSVDYRHGNSTGVSAADRSRTIRALVDPDAKTDDFARPGHVFPLECRKGGVLVRAGHTEAALDLARLAKRAPAGVLAELVNDDGTMKRLPQLVEFATEYGLRIVSIDALIRYRRQRERLVERVQAGPLSTRHGILHAVQYRCELEGVSPFALVKGDIGRESTPLVRVHAQNVLSDAIGLRHAEGSPNSLDAALGAIAASACGVLVYIPRRTADASITLFRRDGAGGSPLQTAPPSASRADWRETGIGCEILADLGAHRIRLIDDSGNRYPGIEGFGIQVLERLRFEQLTR